MAIQLGFVAPVYKRECDSKHYKVLDWISGIILKSRAVSHMGNRRGLMRVLCVVACLSCTYRGFLHAYALCHHGLGHFEESGDVGALDVIDVAICLGAIFHAVLMDVVHDTVEIVVNLLTGPVQPL